MSARRTAGVVASVVTVGAVAAAVTIFNLPDTGNNSSSASDKSTVTGTADIAKETLVDRESHDGTLGHGSTTTLASRGSGTVTWLPSAGTTIGRGKPLYKLDNKPVVLLYGSLPAYRDLKSGVKGADVKQFEKNLWALGYRGFTVDDKYTASTAGAVKDWQDDLGLSETGTVTVGQIAYAPQPVRVDSLSAEKGGTAQPGAEVLNYTGTSLVATVVLDMDAQRLARTGAAVQVELPDGKKVNGKITEVAASVQQGQGDQPDTTVLDVTIGFTGATPPGYDQASVTAYFTASQRPDVLTVPVSALLALAEGGYAVEKVGPSSGGSGTRTLVGVETGIYADGLVEITSAELAEGDTVVVPA
jgi:peptidoglycan hydrolase-like protein with peptidoglycan-binding domain